MDNKKLYEELFPEDEKPLDRIINDGGMFSIFRRFACIGDSLSSGELEGTNAEGGKTYHDLFEYSWGQFMARAAGSTAFNFSRGGMTAKEYNDSFAESKGFWDKDKAVPAYIMALGVNDISRCNAGTMRFGDICDVDLADCEKNADTFVGHFAKIISRYRNIQPDSYFFLVTLPKGGMGADFEIFADRHAEIMYKLAEMYGRTYVIDIRKYGPVYDAEFRKRFFLGGHLNVAGYLLTAKLFLSYTDYIIRHDIGAFRQSGFIGTPYRNTADV